MADLMDLSQERQALLLDAQIASARKFSVTPSAFKCEDCDAPIPAARRVAIPGVYTCVGCQHIREVKGHLFARNA
ncbi:TraR/DksA family transcriptional regulator [Serratia liquefaciens]|uniref:TraR/DksA family transcriptional regulator n=1 Tax=Serratia liquefaciens TaxID=614 RepID=UPI0039B0ED8C